MTDPSLVAFSIAIGGTPGVPMPFPNGAGVTAPADLFLTVHPGGSGMVAELVQAGTNAPVGPASSVSVDAGRRQVEVRVPHTAWNPGNGMVRLAAGVGLWNKAGNSYIQPVSPTATADQPGGGAPGSPAFFNVAFRGDEPMPLVSDVFNAARSPAWWRDRAQGEALATGDVSPFHADVDFGKLAAGTRDDGGVPQNGPIDRILVSRYDFGQGADWSQTCLTDHVGCRAKTKGQLQPYAIYVPRKPMPSAGYGMTLLMHSLSTNYNQYLTSRNQSQFGERGPGSIVITPEARGPDGAYFGPAGADVFEVWADVARRYKLDPAWTVSTGYSMGGIGTFKLAEQFPDLFAKAQPTVGSSDDTEMVANLRNVPTLMWNGYTDELVPPPSYLPTAQELDRLGYRYELDIYAPGEHNSLAINDQFAPAADFLGTTKADRDPAHVTYVVNPALDYPKLGFVADHAYWMSKLRLRSTKADSSGDPHGTVDVLSHGFGEGDAKASDTGHGAGALTGGGVPAYPFTRQFRTWGGTPRIANANRIDLLARNVSTATIDVDRAKVRCDVRMDVDTDGPITIRFAGCKRVLRLGCVNSRGGAAGTRLGPARLGRTRKSQRRVFHGKALKARRGMDSYCATGGGRFRIGYPTSRLSRSARTLAKKRAIVILTSSKRFSVRGVRPGSSVKGLRRRLRGERRLAIGGNAWYLARGHKATLLYKTHGRRVLEVGIGDRRLTGTGGSARRFLRSWELRRR
jgi:hypothetical protein